MILHVSGVGGAAGLLLDLGLFLLLLLHSLALVLLLDAPGPAQQKARRGLLLLIPLAGPLVYLLHLRARRLGGRRGTGVDATSRRPR